MGRVWDFVKAVYRSEVFDRVSRSFDAVMVVLGLQALLTLVFSWGLGYPRAWFEWFALPSVLVGAYLGLWFADRSRFERRTWAERFVDWIAPKITAWRDRGRG